MSRILGKNKNKLTIRGLMNTQEQLEYSFIDKESGEKAQFSSSQAVIATGSTLRYLENHGLIKKVDEEQVTIIGNLSWRGERNYRNTLHAYDLETKEIVPMSRLENGGKYGVAKGLAVTVNRYVFEMAYDNTEDLKLAITKELKQELRNTLDYVNMQ